MDGEQLLLSQLNMLQAEMLDFSKKISPAKKNIPARKSSVAATLSNNLQSTVFNIIFSIFKILACVIGPTIFPAVVYCAEGSSYLFWQAVIISCLVVFMLAVITLSVMWNNVVMVKLCINELITMFQKMVKNRKTQKFMSEMESSDILRSEKIYKILSSVIVLCVTAFAGFLSYKENILTLFYALLMGSGFILRILLVQVYNYFYNKEVLPFHSPCGIEVNFTKPSPPSKRELDFSKMGSQPLLSLSCFKSPLEIREKGIFLSIQDSPMSDMAFLPNTPPPSYQEAISGTPSLEAPSNFKHLLQAS